MSPYSRPLPKIEDLIREGKKRVRREKIDEILNDKKVNIIEEKRKVKFIKILK